MHCPGTGLIVAQEGHRVGTDINGQCHITWEASYTGTFEVDTTLHVSTVAWAQRPSLEVRMEWTGDQFIQLNANHMDTHEGWWDGDDREIEGSVSISTSFDEVTTAGLSYSHALATSQMTQNYEVWWAEDQRLQLSSQSNYSPTGGSATMTINTPFTIQNIVYTNEYAFANNQLSASGTITVDGEVINYEMTGTLDVENIAVDTTLEITTPYSGYESITSHVNYNMANNEKTLSIHSEWSGDTMDFEVTMSAANVITSHMEMTKASTGSVVLDWSLTPSWPNFC